MHLALHSASLLMTYGEKRMVCKVANFGHSKERRDSFLSGLLTTIDTLPWLAPEVFAAPDSITEKVRLRRPSVQLSPRLRASAEACLTVFPDTSISQSAKVITTGRPGHINRLAQEHSFVS